MLIWHWEIWDSKELLEVEVNHLIMELFLNEKERSSEKDYPTEKNMQKTWADIAQGIKSGADSGKDGISTFHSLSLSVVNNKSCRECMGQLPETLKSKWL